MRQKIEQAQKKEGVDVTQKELGWTHAEFCAHARRWLADVDLIESNVSRPSVSKVRHALQALANVTLPSRFSMISFLIDCTTNVVL